MIDLYDYQRNALSRMKNGCILCGGVGGGKSRTAIAYYYICNGGDIDSKRFKQMKNPKPLYIITTARKRDTLEWEDELIPFHIFHDNSELVIDSWNNISKYSNVKGAFFIFDEQRVIGSGAWVNAFLKIARGNNWILLSATPGDTWMEYLPVFIANGFFKNRAEFKQEHVVYKYHPYVHYPQVDHYVNTGKLCKLRNDILIDMDFVRQTESHEYNIFCDYDNALYKNIMRSRWNIYDDQPIVNAAELCFLLRRAVNSSDDRLDKYLDILESHDRAIVFYNYDYELDILKNANYGLDVEIAEWNGHKHEPVPTAPKWVYLVNYSAGAEGWNCITTDTMIFYSQNYSYKIMEQASGRINRLNTPYHDLFYYHLKSYSPIDRAISLAILNKKKFNEAAFAKEKK